MDELLREGLEGEGERQRSGESEGHGTIGRTLTQMEASACLTCIGPTFRCVNNEKTFTYPSYAYIAMEIIGRNISDITILPSFVHVIYLNLTNNRLTDDSLEPLKEMNQLKILIIDKNLVQCVASIPDLNNLQLLSIKENVLTTCELKELENLLYLDLSYNEINNILPHLWCPSIVPRLKELSMRGNGLKKTSGFLFTNLVSLFLAENNITKIHGLHMLPNLQFLHLRNNPLSQLKGFSSENKKLWYLNIRDCIVENEKELENLKVLTGLKRIVVLGNPFWDAEHGSLRLLKMLPNIKRINKIYVDEKEIPKSGRNSLEEEDNHEDQDKSYS